MKAPFDAANFKKKKKKKSVLNDTVEFLANELVPNSYNFLP